MTSTIDESDVILQPVISLLLAVPKQKQVTSTAAYSLVHSVFKQCEGKLRPYLFDDEQVEEEGFKLVVVDDENVITQDGCLTETRDDSVEVHASIHDEDVCNENDKTAALNTQLGLSNESDNTSANVGIVEIINIPLDDGHVESRYDEAFKSANNDDSTFNSNDDNSSEFGIVFQNRPVERSVNDDFNIGDLESNLNREIIAHEGQNEQTLFEQSYHPIRPSNLGVLAPIHDEDLVLDKFPFDVDLTSRELCLKDDREEANCGKHGADYKSENLYEYDSSHGSHHLAG